MGFQRAFDPGQIARMLGVSRSVVVKWIDTNKLPGYLVPFTKRRKVRSSDLQKFCKDQGLSFLFEPLIPLAKVIKQRTVLVCGLDPNMVKQVDELVSAIKVDVKSVQKPYDLLALALHKKVIGVAIDMGIGRDDAMAVGARLKTYEKEMQTVALVYGDEGAFPDQVQAKHAFNCVVTYPFAPAELAELLTIGRRSW